MKLKNRLLFDFFLLLLVIPLCGQEPAYFQGSQAVRFPVGPDVYYYVLPCSESNLPPALPSITPLPSLCWPVRAAKVALVNGKRQASAFLIGSLKVSATNLKFVPFDPKESAFAFDSPLSAVGTQYDPNSQSAFFFTQQQGYQFAFLNACELCASGTTPPPLDKAKLEIVYKLFSTSLRTFAPVAEHINTLATNLRIEFTPQNQPVLTDPAGAMKLYGALNQRLADFCSEPARSCVQTFTRYQQCAATSSPSTCGPPPSCTSTCNIDPVAFKATQATLCTARNRNSASAVPDWTVVFLEQDALRAAHPATSLQIIPETPDQITARLSAIKQGCSVAQSYEVAQMSHLASLSTHNLASGATRPSQTSSTDTLRVPSVPEGLMRSYMLKTVQPVYPPVAKAAHVSGTVLLHAIVSREGTIADLSVISGPDLLRNAALDAVRQWTFSPYVVNGAPIEVGTSITVKFGFNKAAPPATQP